MGPKAQIEMLTCRTCGTLFACPKYVAGRRRACSRSCHLAHIARLSTTHGASQSAEYRIWSAMKERCQAPLATGFKDYGGRGIRVCERWSDSFEAFLQDVGPRPDASLTLDRIDNDGHYEPSNVRWASRKTNQNNRRVTRFIEHGGEKLSVAQWSERVGIHRDTIVSRITRGWTVARALSHDRGPRVEVSL